MTRGGTGSPPSHSQKLIVGSFFGVRLYVPVNNFSVMAGRSHCFLGITSTFGKVKLFGVTSRSDPYPRYELTVRTSVPGYIPGLFSAISTTN